MEARIRILLEKYSGHDQGQQGFFESRTQGVDQSQLRYRDLTSQQRPINNLLGWCKSTLEEAVMVWEWVLTIMLMGTNPDQKVAGKFPTRAECQAKLIQLKKEEPRTIGRCEQRTPGY